MSNNPFVNAIIGILNDLKLWGLAIIGPIAVVVIVINAVKYKGSDEVERKGIVKNIRNTIIMAGGVYALIWIVSYVMTKMAAAAGSAI